MITTAARVIKRDERIIKSETIKIGVNTTQYSILYVHSVRNDGIDY